MAEYNNQSIDIDLEDMFNNLSDKDQEEFLVDMFQNLSVEETRKNVVKDNIWYLDADSTIEIIEDAFNTLNSSSRQEAAERIADALTPEQREALVEYIKDECINPHVIEYAVEGADNWGWKVMTANTQFGWIWGYSIQKGKHGYDSPVAYPSRYDTLSIFYGNEKEAEHDALTCIIRDLEKNAGTKNTNLLL